MKWATHIRITREVFDSLGIRLTYEEDEKLREGVIAPDKWKNGNYNDRTSHHYGRSAEIQNYLKTARSQLLENDLSNAYFNLGIALHFIQDSFTTYPTYLKTQNIDHEKWENWIDEKGFYQNISQALNNIKNQTERQRCYWLNQELIKDIEGPNDTFRIATINSHQKTEYTIANPSVDYNLAYRASYAIVKSITGPKSNQYLDNRLNKCHIQHEQMLLEEETKASNRLLGLVSERNALVKSKKIGGIIETIKNWFTDRKINSKENELLKLSNNYFNKQHLENVAHVYNTEVMRITNDYAGWYRYQIPELKIDSVISELISIDTASEILKVTPQNVRIYLSEKEIPIHNVGMREVIKRAALDRI